ncbi:MAG: hypothetical protein ACKVRN_13785 [Pyrinomonadaceae bacterium]
MNAEQTTENWQIEFNGQIIESSFEDITAMIDKGDLLRMDRVRKEEDRWIEAGKVPSLLAVFNAKDGDEPPKPVITLTKLGPTSVPGSKSVVPASAAGQNVAYNSTSLPPADVPTGRDSDTPVCAMHSDVLADFVCGTCYSNFCRTCPKSYGGSVKICPYCGAMCESLAKMAAAQTHAATYSAAMVKGFGFSDFGQALAYPFKFRTSLIIGAVMYMFFSIGTGAMGFGGIFRMGAALGCYLLVNTLTFGILSHTIENFAQGKIGEDFMPSFDEFSLWDDVVHPFFLSIGAWLVSFGPLVLLMIVAFFFLTSSIKNEMNAMQSDAAQTVAPQLPYAQKAANQSIAVQELLNKTKEKQKQRIEEIEREAAAAESYESFEGGLAPQFDEDSAPRSIAPEAETFNRQNEAAKNPQNQNANTMSSEVVAANSEEEEFAKLNQLIQDTRKAQLEGVVGKAPDTKADERWQMLSTIVGYGMIFVLIGGVFLLWGLFYFPAACAVAGYTKSFAATLNPTVGLDTIRRLGVDYIKILLMALVLVIVSGVIGAFFGIIFFAFNMPGLGNIPANAFSSLFGFYLWIVFSCVLGFALFKAGDRLKLPS